jgi:hypothetical protein
MRNIIHHRFIKSRNEFYGNGLPNVLETIQEEANTRTNMSIDRENITGNPLIFADYTASFDRDHVGYHPGQVVRVNAPRENVMIPQWPAMNMESLALRHELMAFAEDLSQVTSEAAGRSSDRPNAPRTARGQQMLLGERQFAISYQAESVGSCIQSAWKQVYAWNAMYLPPNKEFRIFGTDEAGAIENRAEIRGDFDFRFEAGQAVLNAEMRRILFANAFQLIGPFLLARPESITPWAWRVLRETLVRHSIKSPERFLPPPVEDPGYQLQPAEEHQMFAMGRPVSVHPMDNDQVHLSQHLLWMATDEFDSLQPNAVRFYEQHVMEHRRRIMAAVQSQGMGSGSQTGAQLDQGALGLQGNPLVNSSPGQPPGIQPEAVGAPGGALQPLGPLG